MLKPPQKENSAELDGPKTIVIFRYNDLMQ